MQTLLTVAEHLMSNLENETERIKQAQKQYDELLHRYEDTIEQWAVDKDKIRKQREEIGRKKQTYSLNVSHVIRLCFKKDLRVSFRSGMA